MKKKILIVEDDADVRLGWTLLLGREFETVCAEDGTTATTVARRELPDAIILDLGLPGGDGLRVLEWMRTIPELAFTPKLVVTGRDASDLDEQAMGRGATRVFRKPVESAELLEALLELTAEPSIARRSVLVVEDDADVREALSIQLHANAYTVHTAADGAAALTTAVRETPDVVVLDLGLPAGDGFKVIERLRAIEGIENTPVVVLSGRDASSVREEAIAAGANAYLQKPSDTAELLHALEEVLR